ncbi:tyrosinase family protein [Streptomyces sp. NPDC057565]|uniref:tyrosinase family protein n=1 Tax=Streptomyces sp. NPDC057565 TaxID=3346169 RepID=UPI0036C5B967
MAPASSPNGPVFFLHHANGDWLWEKWMNCHGRTCPRCRSRQTYSTIGLTTLCSDSWARASPHGRLSPTPPYSPTT